MAMEDDGAALGDDISSLRDSSSTSEEGRGIVQALGEVIAASIRGTPRRTAETSEAQVAPDSEMPSASAAPSALSPTMPAASQGLGMGASVGFERGQPLLLLDPLTATGGPIPLADAPRASDSASMGIDVPIQDAAHSVPALQDRAPAPSTPPRASRDARKDDAVRTRTPPGAVAKAVAKLSSSAPSPLLMPQVFL
jgi:hypothetical protein